MKYKCTIHLIHIITLYTYYIVNLLLYFIIESLFTNYLSKVLPLKVHLRHRSHVMTKMMAPALCGSGRLRPVSMLYT